MDWSTDWQQLLVWSSALAVLAVLGTLVGVPWAIGRLPRDYFLRERRQVWYRVPGAPLYSFALALLKNLFGLALFALGLLMLFTPGQGILTMLIGMMLMNFPGKYRLERKLVTQDRVMHGLNWLRLRRGQPPFDMPPEAEDGSHLPGS